MNQNSIIDSPSFFYKYYAFNKNIEKIFTHNELYFPSPKKFNDPFDSRNPISCDGNYADWQNYFQNRIGQQIPGLNGEQKQEKIKELIKNTQEKLTPEDLTNSYINKIGVFCITEKKDNVLMWSHYANGHKGICLEFQSISTNPFFEKAQVMNYEYKYPKPNILRSTKDEITQATLLTKSKDWEYEKEWRIIDHDNGPGLYNFPAELLTGVILGCSMAKEHKDLITKLTLSRNPKPKIYQAKKKKDDFGLDIIEIK